MRDRERESGPKPPASTGERDLAPAEREDRPARPVTAHLWGPAPVLGTGEAELHRVAALQRDCITTAQLLAAGVTRSALSRRVASGRLHRILPAIYRLGSVPVPLQHETAAVLYADGHAALGAAGAAHLWGWFDDPPPEPIIALAYGDRRTPGLVVHRAADLTPDDIRLRHGLPVTSPIRTMLDIAGHPQAEEALARATFRGHVTEAEIRGAAARWPGKRGIARLRALAADGIATERTRSERERRLLKLVRAAGLPKPLTSVRVLGLEVDVLWPAAKLIVEFDGYEFHGDRLAFERDRRRDQVLVAAGYRVIRVTDRQLIQEPFGVIARIAQALALALAA